MPSPTELRRKARAILDPIDLTVGLADKLRHYFYAATDEGEEDTYGAVADDLSNAAAALGADGEMMIEDADCLHAEWTGHMMLGAAESISKIADEARHEHGRRKIDDFVRATLTCPASEVMAALAWDAASRGRPAA